LTNSVGDFVWYELMTTDPDGAAAFYGSVVGWRIDPHADPAAGGMNYRMIVRGDGGNAGGVLGLSPEMTGAGTRPAWFGYISVADVDAAVAAITAEGGTLQMPAFDIAVGRIAMVADPQGAMVYLMKPIPPADKPDMQSDVFSPTEPQRMRWNELATSNDEAAVAFYTRHFGWTQEGAMDMGPMGPYRFIQKDGVGLGAVMRQHQPGDGSRWTFYIGVADIDTAIEAVTAGGGTVMRGPMEIPGGEFTVNGIDPQGAAFALVGPRKG
jgi:predicted enzyme related to lactoylglutathione lyase